MSPLLVRLYAAPKTGCQLKKKNHWMSLFNLFIGPTQTMY